MNVKVKICGIRTMEAAHEATHAGADFLGFNFVSTSKRFIQPKLAEEIIKLVKGQVQIVGVFQDASVAYVNEVASNLKLDFVQLHGHENNQYISQIKAPVIKSIHTDDQLQAIQAEYFLLDRSNRGKGEMVNLKKASQLASKFPLFFAGGLNSENVTDSIKKVRPFAVDVAAGIETDGVQDIQKIKKFIRNAKSINNKLICSGHFGKFGGRFVPEMLIPALEQLEKTYLEAKKDKDFREQFKYLLKTYCGRPIPLTYAKNLSEKLGGAKIYLKNEGLNPTGAHKITHCLGQALLAKRMGKTRLIAETGAGQHGVATATVAAKFGFSCTVYMGEVDIARQRPNVFLMEQLGAQVIPVKFGQRTLKDAVNAALKDYIENVTSTHYCLGSVVGPHPYPTINRDFQSIVGKEIRKQIKEMAGTLPDYIIACVGGGSNAMGAFTDFIKESSVHLIGVEAGGKGRHIGEHAVRFPDGSIGVVEGYKSYFLQDNDGNLQKTHSISAGLDYPGIGPELAYLQSSGRVEFTSVTDKETLEAFKLLALLEGVIPALESAHAVAEAIKLSPKLRKDQIIVVNLSGRGDKDIFILAKAFKDKNFFQFLKDYLKEEGKR